MTLVARWRARRLAGEIARRAAAHDAAASDEAARATQLDLLNAEWSRIVASVPFWSDLVTRGGAPRRFDSIDEFAAIVPVTRRGDLKLHRDAMTCRGRGPDAFRITGGSTAEPLQLPAWSTETTFTRPDMWIGRGWYGITPSSRLFLIWGHAHLLGSGWRGRLRAWRVKASDRAFGYHRFSAYDLRPERLRLAAATMIRFRPDYLIGYSVALDLFARENASMRSALRGLGLRAVIGTAESFPAQDSVARLEDLFGCPVAMEYGAVETALVAHSRPTGGYAVFWNTYLAECAPSGAGHALRVTSLYPRCFPLVRYELGDEIEVEGDGPRIGLRSFERVIGRCNDYVLLEDGAIVHSELFTHAVRSCRDIRAYQIVQEGRDVRIRYVAAEALSAEDVAAIRERLARIHPVLASVPVERVDGLETTVAGKSQMVIRR